MIEHLVQFSTGAGSAEVARRVAARHDPETVVLVTADTLVEDPDNWRFARDVFSTLPAGVRWVRLTDGRHPMEVGRDERVVPNNRLAVCSRVLKRETIRGYLDGNHDPARSIVYLGYDWTETHRLDAAVDRWRPWEVAAPLVWPPYLTKAALLDSLRADGIEPPRLYAAGFSHANCGGACVRGGQAQWALLLRTNPRLYRWWEAEEQRSRDFLRREVSILRDRSGGHTRPLSLRDFRLRLTAEPTLFVADEWGACGCSDDDLDDGFTPVTIRRPAIEVEVST